MTTSTSRAAYSDCFELFDRALDSPAGIRNTLPTEGQARHLQTRLNYARTLSREESSQVYEPDHPEYGTSPYDILIVQVRGKDVYIRRRSIVGEVQELAAE